VRRLWAVATLAAALLSGPHDAAAQADVALVLAVDVSGSVNEARFRLQREGIAATFESEELMAILSGGKHRAIEIAIVEWAEEQQVILPWTLLRSREDLATVAARLRTADRSWVHNETDPGAAIAAAVKLLDHAPLVPDRKVIDMSGDGKQNVGDVPAAVSRDAAVAREITINGLPITSGGEPAVDKRYSANVDGGPGAFVVVADGFGTFAEAFRQKLLLEIAGMVPRPQLADGR
jgi:hypothetical protein